MIFILCMLGCRNGPPRISTNGDTVKVDVATLGEYPTTIARIRLEDQSDHVLWEVVANDGSPQIHEITFKAGLNSSSAPDSVSGKYRVVIPKSDDTFELHRGRAYRLDLWSEQTGKPASVEVKFPN